jgi:hypothetical protein
MMVQRYDIKQYTKHNISKQNSSIKYLEKCKEEIITLEEEKKQLSTRHKRTIHYEEFQKISPNLGFPPFQSSLS